MDRRRRDSAGWWSNRPPHDPSRGAVPPSADAGDQPARVVRPRARAADRRRGAGGQPHLELRSAGDLPLRRARRAMAVLPGQGVAVLRPGAGRHPARCAADPGAPRVGVRPGCAGGGVRGDRGRPDDHRVPRGNHHLRPGRVATFGQERSGPARADHRVPGGAGRSVGSPGGPGHEEDRRTPADPTTADQGHGRTAGRPGRPAGSADHPGDPRPGDRTDHDRDHRDGADLRGEPIPTRGDA